MRASWGNAGTHAAGVIIADRPIIEYVPLHRPTKGAADNVIQAVTQFEMSVVESLGLLKVDFLGLAMLTVMARASLLMALLVLSPLRHRRGDAVLAAAARVDQTPRCHVGRRWALW